MTYRAVYCLWITPDFSEVMAGRAEPPRINHDIVDFKALAKLLDSVFHYGPPKRIYVPNDTIDQTTVHTRLGLVSVPKKRGVGSYRCEDFGDAALVASRSSTKTVFDVRAAWNPLHHLPERSFAPPPCGVVFVMETKDFEDNMIAGASLRPAIGMQMIGPGLGHPPENESGSLPNDLKSGLERVFGCKFERECVVDRMAQDQAPSEYGDVFNTAIQEKLAAAESKDMEVPIVTISRHKSGFYEWAIMNGRELVDGDVGDSSISSCLSSAVACIPDEARMVEVRYRSARMGTFPRMILEEEPEVVAEKIADDYRKRFE